jgi:hypothetical protein
MALPMCARSVPGICFDDDGFCLNALGYGHTHQFSVMRTPAVINERLVEGELVRSPFGAAATQRGERNDPEQVLVRSLQGGEPLHVTLAHDPFSFLNGIVLKAEKNICRHRLTSN